MPTCSPCRTILYACKFKKLIYDCCLRCTDNLTEVQLILLVCSHEQTRHTPYLFSFPSVWICLQSRIKPMVVSEWINVAKDVNAKNIKKVRIKVTLEINVCRSLLYQLGKQRSVKYVIMLIYKSSQKLAKLENRSLPRLTGQESISKVIHHLS